MASDNIELLRCYLGYHSRKGSETLVPKDHFELAESFDIAQFRDVLSDIPTTHSLRTSEAQAKEKEIEKDVDEGAAVIPADDEWETALSSGPQDDGGWG